MRIMIDDPYSLGIDVGVFVRKITANYSEGVGDLSRSELVKLGLLFCETFDTSLDLSKTSERDQYMTGLGFGYGRGDDL